MVSKTYPIPGKLNIILATLVIFLCLTLLWAAGQVQNCWAVGLLALAYAFVKHMQFYGILTGFFWLMILLSNFIAVLNPAWLARKTSLDRPTAALQETLNPKYFRLIRLEAILVLLLHGSMIYFFRIPPLRYFAVLCGFGFLWSTLQYLHHYATVRDVQKGALNVRTWRVFDLIWLNHHWHLNHHLHPTVPWPYLPRLQPEGAPPPAPFWRTYFRQWRGPRFTTEHVQNRHAGFLIK